MRPCSATISRGVRHTVMATAPNTSMRCSRRVCGMLSTLATTASATTPMGTLTRNTHRQPVTCRIGALPAKKPPMTGPSTLEVPNTARK